MLTIIFILSRDFITVMLKNELFIFSSFVLFELIIIKTCSKVFAIPPIARTFWLAVRRHYVHGVILSPVTKTNFV